MSGLFHEKVVKAKDYVSFGHFSECHQGCSGAGTCGNGVPTPFSRFALK